jgi:lysyl-tRNA synthetase class 2
MLEFYQAYANYLDLMTLTQELIEFVAREVNGSTVTYFGGVEIDLAKWERLTMREAIIKWWPEGMLQVPTLSSFDGRDSLLAFLRAYASLGDKTVETDSRIENRAFFLGAWCAAATARIDANEPYGKVTSDLFEAVAEFGDHLIQPTIIYEFPLAVSPLSKQKPDEPDWVERFEFYIGGFELGNAFSELNDPEEQLRRFKEQLEQHERGDEEAHQMDVDYVRALAYGMPPTAGEGIGIDRLTMILTGAKSIRDVILFPLLRPQSGPEPA